MLIHNGHTADLLLPVLKTTSGIPGFAMEHYKALYSTVAPYHGSLVI